MAQRNLLVTHFDPLNYDCLLSPRNRLRAVAYLQDMLRATCITGHVFPDFPPQDAADLRFALRRKHGHSVMKRPLPSPCLPASLPCLPLLAEEGVATYAQ